MNNIGIQLVGSNPVIMTSVPNIDTVFVSQPITISCMTSGTKLLAWESNEYIGPGGQLAFGSEYMEGMRLNNEIMNHTFVILTRVVTESAELQLESQLHLTVTPKHRTFTIICRNVDQDLAENITFYIRGEYMCNRDCQSELLFVIVIFTR